jgi:hypothetical protein
MTNDASGAKLPSVAESVQMLEGILAVWRDPALTSTELPVLDSRVERGMFALGQADHAAGLTDAVLVLAKSGMFVQAVPLVRLTLECAITAAWFAVTPGSGEAASKDFAHSRENLVIAMEDLADPAGRIARQKIRDAARAAAKASGEEEIRDALDGEASLFEQRCRALAGGGWAYPYYRLLSEYSHGGAGLLEHYGRPVDPSPENPLGLEYDPEREFEYSEIVIGVQATALIIALKAWDDLAPKHPMHDQLAAIVDEMGTVVNLGRKEKSQRSRPPRAAGTEAGRSVKPRR